ncbi:2-dehydropantoate 2-reductase [Prosthecomicrobium sp. N25]|uniref:2-dehydropantoate 2-reductase n=1 Tax=Prosthecomicrobium sp. N25 TaxID=3129254 RepID=UPI00307894E5
MRIAVMGTGGVGGYFGGKLAAAGFDVGFVARGAHGAALAAEGLTIESGVTPIERMPIRVVSDPAELGPVDLVLFAVKLWDTEGAVEQLKPVLTADTVVISFQNGVDAGDRIAAMIGAGHVAGGVCHIGASIARPGVIRHLGTLARLTVGAFDGAVDPRLEAFSAACTRAGIDHALTGDIRRAIWEKFVFLSAMSGVTALTRRPIGDIRADPDLRAFFHDAVRETVAVARARGIGIPAEQADKVMGFADALPAGMKASMLHDLERGARLELPWLSGAVVRMGAEAGVPTPVHRAIWCALKLDAAGR